MTDPLAVVLSAFDLAPADLPALRRFQFAGGLAALGKVVCPREEGTPERRTSQRDAAIADLYLNHGMSLRDIGGLYGISGERVRQVLWANGIVGREVQKARTEGARATAALNELLARCATAKPCPVCGSWNLRRKGNGKPKTTCSVECEPAYLAMKFWARVDRTGGPDACWPWQGKFTAQGYGFLYWPGRKTGGCSYAHRVSHELGKGPIPEGLEVDHLCRDRRCVNPAHLEAVTHRENCFRSPIWGPNRPAELRKRDGERRRKRNRERRTQKVAS